MGDAKFSSMSSKSCESFLIEMMETNGEKRCFPHFEAKTRTRSRGNKKNSKQLQLSQLRFKVEDGWGIVSIIFSEGASQTTSSLIFDAYLSTNPKPPKDPGWIKCSTSKQNRPQVPSLPCLYHEGSQHFLHKTQQPSCESRWSDQRGILDLALPQLVMAVFHEKNAD